MKKMVCFYRAYLASIIMFVATGLFLAFGVDVIPLISAKTDLLILQGILIIKCAAILVIMMPGKAGIKQIVAGFIAADISLLVINLALGGAGFPMHMVIAQGAVVIYYMGNRGLLPAYKPAPVTITMNTELITGNI